MTWVSWKSDVLVLECETERDRDRERERQTDRQTQTDRHRQRETEAHTHTHTHTHTPHPTGIHSRPVLPTHQPGFFASLTTHTHTQDLQIPFIGLWKWFPYFGKTTPLLTPLLLDFYSRHERVFPVCYGEICTVCLIGVAIDCWFTTATAAPTLMSFTGTLKNKNRHTRELISAQKT